jgi:hypothetical protein
VSPCPTTHATLGAAGQYLLSSRDEVFGAHLKQTSDAIGQRERRFAVFLFGHTHLVDRGFRPLERERLGWDPVVVNSGAWQRVVSPDTLAMKNRPAETVLQDSVESLPACYSVVWVEPYTTVPEAKVRSWRQTPDGSWDFGPMCNE